MKYISILLILVLFFSFVSCGKQNQKTDNTSMANTGKTEKDNAGSKLVEENKLKKVATIKNPNTMDIETTARSSSAINEEKKAIEKLAEKFLAQVAMNGLEASLEEVNKSKEGAFKDDVAGPYFYFTISEKTDETAFTIVAHASSRDYIGAKIEIDKWQDLTGWKYINEAVQKYNAGETNRVWVDDVYWKDPHWAEGKVIQFTSYERFYKIDAKDYLFHYCLFKYE